MVCYSCDAFGFEGSLVDDAFANKANSATGTAAAVISSFVVGFRF